MLDQERVTFRKKCEKWVKFSTLIRLISTLPLHICVNYDCNFFVSMKSLE